MWTASLRTATKRRGRDGSNPVEGGDLPAPRIRVMIRNLMGMQGDTPAKRV